MLWYFARMPVCTKLKYICLVLLFLIPAQVFPRVLVQAQSPVPQQHSRVIQRTKQGDVPIISDLNGDRRLDQVQFFSRNNQAFIHIDFAKGGTKQLSFDLPADTPGLLYADDVDHDNSLDLIWMVQNRPDSAVIWLGDGQGNFTSVEDISQFKSSLSHLYIDPFAPGVFGGPTAKNPGCFSAQSYDSQTESEKAFSLGLTDHAFKSQDRNPVRELDNSLAQIQNRPPPSLV